MIDYINQHERQTRNGFKLLNHFMLLMWRLGFGPYMQNPYAGYITVLITTGHKSGVVRRAPINYERDGDTVYCMPGFGAKTHWYRNLLVDPNCELWLPDGIWEGVAEDITDPEERLPLLRRLLIRAGFATRLIEGIDPAQLTDEELRQYSERYDKLVRIRLTKRRETPGDLAWIWPLLLTLEWLLWRIRRPAKSKDGITNRSTRPDSSRRVHTRFFNFEWKK